MPINRGYDKNGCYYQYGSQKKYYYICGNAKSRLEAKKLAIKQMVAIGYSKERAASKKGSQKGSRMGSQKGSRMKSKKGSKKGSRSPRMGSKKGSKKSRK